MHNINLGKSNNVGRYFSKQEDGMKVKSINMNTDKLVSSVKYERDKILSSFLLFPPTIAIAEIIRGIA